MRSKQNGGEKFVVVLFMGLGAALLLALLPSGVAMGLRAQSADCPLKAGALYDPQVPPGTPNADVPIEHIIILMQENRSFDHYFGLLNEFGYDGEVDGLTPDITNPDSKGNPVSIYPEDRYCVESTSHSWNGSHRQYNNGRNDGFVVASESERDNGRRAMGYYSQEDLPYYYALANTFAIGDRYFSPVLGPSTPNRLYLVAGTSFGYIRNDPIPYELGRAMIYRQLDAYGIAWKYYSTGKSKEGESLPGVDPSRNASFLQFYEDLADGRLPQVAFVDTPSGFADEHPPANIQIGQHYVASLIRALMVSPFWPRSALFFTYDEHGGFFDHVPPPPACIPDDMAPRLREGDVRGAFDRYGFRVPIIVVSPYAKRHYVSHEVYDHTSILRFVAMKWNLPALTNRDANASPMLDFFDFKNPQWQVPTLPQATIDADRLQQCIIDGAISMPAARISEAEK